LKRKRVIPLVLATSVLLSCISAYSSAKTTKASSSVPKGYAVSASIGGKTSDLFTIWLGWQSECPSDTVVQDVLRKKLGINYKCEWIQSDDVNTAVNLKLSSGEALPDLMVFPGNDVIKNAMIKSGKVMKLNSLYQSKTLSNIPKIPSQIKKYVTEKNGSIYILPGWYAQDPSNPWPGWTTDAWWVRTDLMKKAGVTNQNLTTISGMEQALQKFSKLKDANGKAIIPLSFIQSRKDSGQNASEEKIILASFGVDTAAGVSGMPAVMKTNGKFVFEYDNPNFKAAYQWMNKLYREGLIDVECSTLTQQRMNEKITNGNIAVLTSDIWANALNNTWQNMKSGKDGTAFYFQPYADPKVSGVTKATVSYVNPYPSYNMFISKDTKHLNAIMHYLDWSLAPVSYRQQEVSEGPVGTNWNWVNKTKGIWDFTASYGKDRNSGVQAKVDKCTPQLWQTSSYSSNWYPWWTQDTSKVALGGTFPAKYCQQIAKYKNYRLMHAYDAVPVVSGSIIDKNLAALQTLTDEYTAKMIMASSSSEFASDYSSFKSQLELQCKWSAMKAEWQKEYTNYVNQHGNF
jgi:hypothetical protein